MYKNRKKKNHPSATYGRKGFSKRETLLKIKNPLGASVFDT
jgi:hypothetical protein